MPRTLGQHTGKGGARWLLGLIHNAHFTLASSCLPLPIIHCHAHTVTVRGITVAGTTEALSLNSQHNDHKKKHERGGQAQDKRGSLQAGFFWCVHCKEQGSDVTSHTLLLSTRKLQLSQKTGSLGLTQLPLQTGQSQPLVTQCHGKWWGQKTAL